MALHYSFTQTKNEITVPPSRELIQSAEPESVEQENPEWRELSRWLSDDLARIIAGIRFIPLMEIEEIRLRATQPLMLVSAKRDYLVGKYGEINGTVPYLVTHEDLIQCLERMTQSSVYAVEEELRHGFITLAGGHRVGVTGKAVMQDGKVQTLKHISALNIRISKEIAGSGQRVLPRLLKPGGTLCHTIILSMPRAGKTTLLRDLIRLLSNGVPQIGLKGQNVSVVDERGELAGMWQGIPSYDLGIRTDILDGCPKGEGMSMMIRAMAPNILAVDELGHQDDVDAVGEALRTGVSVLSTAHAGSVAEAMTRPILKALLEESVFERAVLLSRRKGPGTIEGVYNLSTGLPVLG